MLDSLHRRPRGGARLALVLSRLSGGVVPAGPRHPGRHPTHAKHKRAPAGQAILDSLHAYRGANYVEQAGPATRGLLDRLDEADIRQVKEHLDADTRAIWDDAEPWVRTQLALIFGVHHHVAPVLEKTGLRRDMPPDDVHAMGRGPVAAGGDFWLADVIAMAASQCGVDFLADMRVLDFGCSSGRHLRVLHAWRPEVDWMGCDPNVGAITWADAHLPGIDFFVSPLEPPLALEPESLDAVFAVSVWSHFGPRAAEAWLAEMHRLLCPGGLMIFTTQGIGSLAYFLRGGHVGELYAIQGTKSLLATGHAYVKAFGPEGDWGVKHPDWGMAYMTLEWLAERTLSNWSLDLYQPVRIDNNQDLVVLRRG